MPLDKFVLIILCVIVAAGLTIWLSVFIVAAWTVPVAGIALMPVALAGYVAWRVIAERVGNKQEDHYDEMEN